MSDLYSLFLTYSFLKKKNLEHVFFYNKKNVE